MADDLLQAASDGLAYLTAKETDKDSHYSAQRTEMPMARSCIILPLIPRLSKEQEQDLFQQLEENPDGDSAREKIIESNLRLVLYVAWLKKRRMPAGGILEVDDLFMEGYFGLLKAIEHFDWRLNYRFSSHAFGWINQKICRAIENQNNVIRIPAHVHQTMRRYRKVESTLSQELKRFPSLEEIAERMELPVSRVEYIKQLLSMRIRFSLDETDDDENPESNKHLKLASMKAGRDDDSNLGFRSLMKEAVLKAIDECKALSQKEKEIILLRFGLGETGRPQTLQEVGDRFFVCRERIRQIEVRAISKLRADLNFAKSVKDFIS